MMGRVLAVCRVVNFHLRVRVVALAAGEGVEAGHEGHRGGAPRPEHNGVARIRVFAQEYDRRRVLRHRGSR